MAAKQETTKTKIRRVKIARIHQAETDGKRPPGYAADVLAKSFKVEKGWAWIPSDVYLALAQQYQSEATAAYLQANQRTAARWFKPGDMLRRAIHLVTGVEPDGRCRCKKRIGLMNDGGWRWCWKNRTKIAGWLAKEAGHRGHTIDPARPTTFIMPMLREAWGRLKSPKPDA